MDCRVWKAGVSFGASAGSCSCIRMAAAASHCSSHSLRFSSSRRCNAARVRDEIAIWRRYPRSRARIPSAISSTVSSTRRQSSESDAAEGAIERDVDNDEGLRGEAAGRGERRLGTAASVADGMLRACGEGEGCGVCAASAVVTSRAAAARSTSEAIKRTRLACGRKEEWRRTRG